MKLKILTSIAGERFSFNRGDVVEWPQEAEAKRWIAAGYAEEVAELKAPAKPKGAASQKADGKGGKGEKATLNR